MPSFRGSKSGFTFIGKIRDRFAILVFELDIEIDHFPFQTICENPAGGRLAGATKADKGDSAIFGHVLVFVLAMLPAMGARKPVESTVPGPVDEVIAT